MRGRTIRTPEKGARLLAKLRQGYSIAAACRAEKIGRSSYYEWRDEPAFAKAADDAIEEGTDVLEDKARDRAARESDTLLIFLLKARRPDTYRETIRQEHSGPSGGPIAITGIEVPFPPKDDQP